MAKLTKPIPNPFKKFSTMTYGISLYLQSPKQYSEMMANGTKDVKGMELLVQSGGAKKLSKDTGESVGQHGAIRNKYFTRDFYLDDIQLESYIAGTSTGGPQNTFQVKFAVTEPMGLTFMERLYNAATDFAARQGYKNFNPVNQLYLMVIRFYGYDENGKQIENGKFDSTGDTVSDPKSYIEKWIPLMITKIQFNVESSHVVYMCECVCPQSQAGHGQIHGTIPYNVGLQGSTLADILGPEEDPDGKKSPAKLTCGTKSLGLMDTLNNYQKQLTIKKPDSPLNGKKYEIPNVYKIEFEAGAGISEATLGALGTSSVVRSSTAAGANTKDTAGMSSGDAKQAPKTQTLASNAGMKIVKFIDLAIRNSTYMAKQYTLINDANKNVTNKGAPPKPLKWFKIRPRVKIIGFDSLRQSWAYEITYVVTVYEVASIETTDFNSASCFQPHKEYDFWFTGKNTEVLDFKQEYNTMYYTTFTSKFKADPDENPKVQNNLRAQKTHRPNSIEAHSGENLTDEAAANAASVLYAPQDIANCEIDIVGDPDWLAQSELFYAATTKPTDPTLTDGSINYDKSEVYFSVNFNTVVDYDLQTGLADVTQKNVPVQLDGSVVGSVSQYAFVYRANTIISQFEKGKFTQKLKGTLLFLPESCITGEPAKKRPEKGKPKTSESAVAAKSPGASKTPAAPAHKSPATGNNGTLKEPPTLRGMTLVGDVNDLG